MVVHGYRGEHHGLEPVVAHLRGLRIVSPDLPGFGDSSPLPGRTHDIAAYSEWLSAFVDALGLRGTAVILGHSFGSIVASAAVAAGLATPKLILVNPIAAPALEGPNRFGSQLTLGFYRTARALPEAVGKGLLSFPPIVRGMSAFLVQTKDGALRRWIHDQHSTYFSRYANRDTVVQGFRGARPDLLRGLDDAAADPPQLAGVGDEEPVEEGEGADGEYGDLEPVADRVVAGA